MSYEGVDETNAGLRLEESKIKNYFGKEYRILLEETPVKDTNVLLLQKMVLLQEAKELESIERQIPTGLVLGIFLARLVTGVLLAILLNVADPWINLARIAIYLLFFLMLAVFSILEAMALWRDAKQTNGPSEDFSDGFPRLCALGESDLRLPEAPDNCIPRQRRTVPYRRPYGRLRAISIDSRADPSRTGPLRSHTL